MKKLALITLLAGLGFQFFSCNKKQPAGNVGTNNSKMRQVADAVALQLDQRQMFSLLTPEEKRALWKDHLAKAISNNAFSVSQIRVIQSMLNYFNMHNPYDPAYPNEEAGFDNFLQSWLVLVDQHFSDLEEVYLCMTTFNSYNDYGNYIVNGGGSGGGSGGPPVGQDCECHHVAGSTLDCQYYKYNLGIPLIELTAGVCPYSSECTASSWRCGHFWAQSCNGMCQPK